MTKFYSIEFIDHEGEEIVKHFFLTDEQKLFLIEEFNSRNISVKIHDLTPPQIIESFGVLLPDEQSRLDKSF